MATDNDYPYARRPGLPLVDDEEGLPEAALSTLNAILEMAEEAGVSVGLRFRDAGTQDRSGDRLEAIEWRTKSGEMYFVAELNVVTISVAAKLIGLSRGALARRVQRAHQAGRETPFTWSDWSGCWLADPEAVRAWANSWTGRHVRQPKGAEK